MSEVVAPTNAPLRGRSWYTSLGRLGARWDVSCHPLELVALLLTCTFTNPITHCCVAHCPVRLHPPHLILQDETFFGHYAWRNSMEIGIKYEHAPQTLSAQCGQLKRHSSHPRVFCILWYRSDRYVQTFFFFFSVVTHPLSNFPRTIAGT